MYCLRLFSFFDGIHDLFDGGSAMRIELVYDRGKGRLNRVLIFLMLRLLMVQTACFAETVSLSWDANTESDLAGYKVYYKADSSSLPFDGTGAVEGASPVDVYNLTAATVSGLDPRRTYYFAVTAYNTTGIESPYSNIVTVLESVTTSLSDVLLAVQIGSGRVSPTAEQVIRLDVAPIVNGISVPNGVVDTGDAIVLLSIIVGKPFI